ncbi:MAG: flagellar motor switch protein FliG [Deltaproteobacteria bacterium]|nr:flagellar motor switch protein FliG [Deltaproteobacteria bacterium]
MTNDEKAAILILSLEENLAARVLKNLRPDEIKRIGTSMNRLTKISNSDMEFVAKEFCLLAREKGKRIISVQDDAMRNIIIKALGEERAEKLLDAIEKDTFKVKENPLIDKLKDVDPKILVEFTKMEHPQTIALILAHLKPPQAAEILENLSSEQQVEILKRMATLKSVPQEFIDEMTRALESEIVVSGGGMNEQFFGGINMAAEVLNQMSRTAENSILEAFDSATPELANEIRNLMFTFDDVLKLDDKSMREILQEVSGEDLARAIKSLDPTLQEKILKNMSKRAAEMLMEDIELMPPTRVSEIEMSQKTIIEVAKRLASEGRIVIARGAEEDEFI